MWTLIKACAAAELIVTPRVDTLKDHQNIQKETEIQMNVTKNIHAFLWMDPMTNNANTYFIDAEKKILVDPGHYHAFGHVRDDLSRLSLSPEDIDLVIITHAHPDHMEAIRIFLPFSTLIAFSQIELEFIRRVAPHYGAEMGLSDFDPQILLQEGELNADGTLINVLHTPGHSPGSICLYLPDTKVLISGDVIFNQGIGRTDLPGGSGEELKQSIKRLSLLDAEYLLPGHGDIVSGRDYVRANFDTIERLWFPYL